jgi:hypothetical protein
VTDEPDEVHLAVHAELGVNRRQVVADGALADVEAGGDGGLTMVVSLPAAPAGIDGARVVRAA